MPQTVLQVTPVGGVSGQPDYLRFPSQVTEAVNADFSVVDGLSKRPGTRWYRNVTGTPTTGVPSGQTWRLHPIDRDGTEKYLVAYGGTAGSQSMSIFDAVTSGAAKTLTITAAASTYLGSGSATADDLHFVTLADTTLILNRKVKAKGKTSPAFVVTNVRKNYDVMTSYAPAVDLYNSTAEPTAAQSAGFYKHTVDGAQFASWKGRTVTNTWDQPTDYWDDQDKNPSGFRVVFQSRPINVTFQTDVTVDQGTPAGDTTVTKTGAFTNYTWQSGDYIVLYQDSVTNNNGIFAVKSKTNANTIILEDTVGLVDSTTAFISGIGDKVYPVEVDFFTDQPADMYDVALRIQQHLQRAGALDALVNWNPSTVEGDGYFQIISPYRGSGYKVVGIQGPTDTTNVFNLADPNNSRPFRFVNTDPGVKALDGTSTDGTGSPATNTVGIEDRWLRVPVPGQRNAVPDETTMPLQLIRNADLTWTCSVIDWKGRTTGDGSSNPAPTFIEDQYEIADIAFFGDRLVFVARDQLFMSQSGDYFNLYIDDVENVIPADPIEHSLPGNKVAFADYIIPFNRKLIVFTKSGKQFEVFHDSVLSQENLTLAESTSYNTQAVRPVTMGNAIYFAQQQTGRNPILEYFYDDNRVADTANDITAHCPTYVVGTTGTVRSIVSTTNSRRVIVLGSDSSLYVFREHWSGATRDQLAWFKWTLGHAPTVRDIAIIGNDLWLLTDSNSQVVLEKMPLLETAGETGWAIELFLDRQLVKTGSYGAPNTTWTQVGYGTGTDKIIPRTGTYAYTDLTPSSTTADTVVVAGDYSAINTILGTAYTMTVTLSRPYIRNQAGQPDIDALLQYQRVLARHLNTGDYNIVATYASPPTRTERTTTFAHSTAGGVQSAGFLSANILGDTDPNKGVTLKITSAKHRACRIGSIQMVLDYTPRRG